MKWLPYLWLAAFGFFGFRGTVSHSLLVSVFLLPVLMAGVFSATFRRRFLFQIQQASNRLNTFVKEGQGSAFPSAFFLVGVPMAFLCLLNGRNISSYDNYGTQLTAASLILSGTPNIAAIAHIPVDKIACEHAVTYPVLCNGKGVYSATPAGMLVFAVPSFLVARIVGADLTEHRILWRLSKWTAAWLTGATLTLFFVLALSFGSFDAALWGTVFLGTGSALLSTSGQGLWSNAGVGFALLLSLWGLVILRPRRPALAALVTGFGWSLMLASRLPAAIIILPFAIWVLWLRPAWAIRAGLAGLLGWGVLVVYYVSVYGHPLGPQFTTVAATPVETFSRRYFVQGFSGLLFSPGTGLFIFQPWALLLFFVPWLKRQERSLGPWDRLQRWRTALFVLFAAQLLLFSFWFQWSGQQCWGTRYLTEVIPLVGLLVVAALPDLLRNSKVKRIALGLGIAAALVQTNGAFLSGMQWYAHPRRAGENTEVRCLDWTDPAFLYPLPRLFQ